MVPRVGVRGTPAKPSGAGALDGSTAAMAPSRAYTTPRSMTLAWSSIVTIRPVRAIGALTSGWTGAVLMTHAPRRREPRRRQRFVARDVTRGGDFPQWCKGILRALRGRHAVSMTPIRTDALERKCFDIRPPASLT